MASQAGKGDANRSNIQVYGIGYDRVDFKPPVFIYKPPQRSMRSKTYNWDFNMDNGGFMRWGTSMFDNPPYSKIGPEILDIEISTGKCSGNCDFCYKQNGAHHRTAKNMTLKEYKAIIDKMPENLTQVAIGICDVDTNPDFIQMLEFTRKKGIIPNFTCNGNNIDDKYIRAAAKYCGAVAVSYMNHKSFDTIQRFIDAGVTTNIHYMLAEETYYEVRPFIEELKERCPDFAGAVVFLAYKPKNPLAPYTTITDVDMYDTLIKYLTDEKVPYGFDSCSAPMFLKAMKDDKDYFAISMFVDSCESGLFSAYVNWQGDFYPCSFMEGEGDWETGISVLHCNNFIKDVWRNDKTLKWRKKLTECVGDCRKCPHYKLD
jgi:radical SAM protein with 4Fe4S-binding SPASM domain